MKVLLDVGISPRLPLQSALDDTPVESAVFHQWRTLRDDELLAQAGLYGFTTLVTTDKQLAAQQRHPYIAVIAVDDNRLTLDRTPWRVGRYRPGNMLHPTGRAPNRQYAPLMRGGPVNDDLSSRACNSGCCLSVVHFEEGVFLPSRSRRSWRVS